MKLVRTLLMYMVWSSVGFPKNQILKAGFEFSEFIWEMIQISAGRGVGSETDEERSLAKDILISRSLIWAMGSPHGGPLEICREYMQGCLPQEPRTPGHIYQLTVIHHWLRVTPGRINSPALLALST